MAWLYKRPGSSNWWIGYRTGGRQFLKSTRTRNRKQAESELEKFEVMAAARRTGALTEDFVNALNGNAQPKVTIRNAVEVWLASCEGTTSAATRERYRDVASTLCDFFASNTLLRDIGPDQLQSFLVAMRERRAVGSVNLTRKILSVFFNYGVGRGYITTNPIKATKRFKITKTDKKKRRPFSTEELRSVIAHAPNPFWRYMVLGGIYTGLALGDLIVLRVSEIDLQHNELALERGKTGAAMHIPIARPFLLAIRERLDKKKHWNPSEFLWPDQAARYLKGDGRPQSGPFSKEFYEDVLVPAGLAVKRDHKRRKEAEAGGKRTVNELSFHSFRHTFISMLKLSGASQSVAKELAGHTSDAISDLYTTIPVEVLHRAVSQLPEIPVG